MSNFRNNIFNDSSKQLGINIQSVTINMNFGIVRHVYGVA